MVKYLVLLNVLFFFTLGLSADKEIIKEFTSAEAFYKFKNSPDPNPSEMLKKNVKDALTLTLQRHFTKEPELLKGLSTADYQFEQVFETNIVIAKYDDYIFEFRYTANPSKFHLIPMKYKYYRVPDEKKEQTELPTENSGN